MKVIKLNGVFVSKVLFCVCLVLRVGELMEERLKVFFSFFTRIKRLCVDR